MMASIRQYDGSRHAQHPSHHCQSAWAACHSGGGFLGACRPAAMTGVIGLYMPTLLSLFATSNSGPIIDPSNGLGNLAGLYKLKAHGKGLCTPPATCHTPRGGHVAGCSWASRLHQWVNLALHTPPSIPATISYKLHRHCQVPLETSYKLHDVVVWM